MSENSEQNPSNQGSSGHVRTRQNLLVVLLGVLVSMEAMLASVGAVYFLRLIFLESPDNFSGAIVIFVITVIIAAGLIVTAIGTFKVKSWTRGAIVTWQIMQFAVSTSFIQGVEIWQIVGWGSLCLSLTTLSLVIVGLVTQKQS